MPSKNYVYAVISTSPAPTGRGTMAEWLEFYKLGAEGETFVPCDPVEGIPEEGDALWFQVDDRIIATVRIKRVMLDPFRDVFELWYDGEKVIRINGIHTEDRGSRWIETDTASNWHAYANKIQSAGLQKSTGSE